jgi:hypothetical protein
VANNGVSKSASRKSFSSSGRCLGVEYFYNTAGFGHSTTEEYWPSFLILTNDRLTYLRVGFGDNKYRQYSQVNDKSIGVTLSADAFAPSTPYTGFYLFGTRTSLFPQSEVN